MSTIKMVVSELSERFKDAAIVDDETATQAFNRIVGYNSYNILLRVINALRKSFPEQDSEICDFIRNCQQAGLEKRNPSGDAFNSSLPSLIGEEPTLRLAYRIAQQFEVNPAPLIITVHDFRNARQVDRMQYAA